MYGGYANGAAPANGYSYGSAQAAHAPSSTHMAARLGPAIG